MEVTAPRDICYPSSLPFIQYLPIPLLWNTLYILYYEDGNVSSYLRQKFRDEHPPRI